MYSNGLPDYDRGGKELKTGILAGRAAGDAEVRATQSGKRVASVSVRAYGRRDGTAAFIRVKTFDQNLVDQLAFVKKGDRILAAGRLEISEYNGKTYADLMADFLMVQRAGDPPPAAPPPMGPLSDEEDGMFPF